MTVAELIALINQEITANGNNEITGPILNDILVKMVNQINEKVGELSDLETSVTTDIVAAINSVLNSQNIGVVVHYGQNDPNVTPPSSYEIGDMYSKENVLSNTTDLFIYTGVPSVWWLNLTSLGGWVESVTGNIVDNTDPLNPVVTQVQSDWNEANNASPSFIKNKPTIPTGSVESIQPSSGVNIDNTDPDNPQPWINDFNLFLNPSGENNTVEWELSGAGDISFEVAELDSPNNKRMIKFDLSASNGALAEYDISTSYIGQKMVFKAMIKTAENLDVRIELDDVEVATAEVESSSEWQLVSIPFTPETGFAGNVKIFIENENAAVYFLDMMYVGVNQSDDASNIYAEVTHSEAETLISTNGLVAGALYHITDADDTISTFDVASSVFIEAVSENEFAEFGSVRMFTPKYYKGVSGYKVWSINETYTTGDIAFWGGKAWVNNVGNTGDKVDDFNLDSEWTLINIGDTDWEDYYNVNLYMCGYDFASNKVLWVDSGNGSKVYSNGVGMSLGNPIKYYQWSNDFDSVYYNGISGIVNNSFINCINNRGVITTLSLDGNSSIYSILLDNGSSINSLSLDNGSYISSLSLDNSSIGSLSLDSSNITTLSLDSNSSIGSLSLDSSGITSLSLDSSNIYSLSLGNSNITTLSLYNSSYINTLSLDSSSITTLSLDSGSSISTLSLDKSNIDEIITAASTEYKAKIDIYGITDNVDIDLTLYPKLLEDGVTATFLQNTSGDIVVFYQDADGGMSASEYIPPAEDEDYIQRKYVDDRLPKLIAFANTQTVTSTTETDITESVIAVEADSTYEIEVNFRVGCSGANGMQFGFKFPTGSTLMRTISGRTTGAGAQNISTNEHTSDTGLINMVVCTAVTEFGNLTGKLLLKVGATAGNFIVTYASVHGAQTSSVFANSYISYTKFA